jgi:hypothetical protein
MLRCGWSRDGRGYHLKSLGKADQINEMSHQAAFAEKGECLWRKPGSLSWNNCLRARRVEAVARSRALVLPIWAQAATAKHSIIGLPLENVDLRDYYILHV